jgi:hypothetical protein
MIGATRALLAIAKLSDAQLSTGQQHRGASIQG